MSSELQWQIIRGRSSFLRVNIAGRREIFSTEAGNLRGCNSFRDNGLVNKKTVDVRATTGDKRGVVFVTNRKRTASKPKKQHVETTLTRGSRRALNAISKSLSASNYRADLKKAALVRASAILRSQKPQAKKAQKKLRGRNKIVQKA